MSPRSPIVTEVRVRRPLAADGSKWRAVTTARITGDEPVFTGHYPGFPIFPGVCVVECVHRSAGVTAPEPLGELAEIESARLLGAVFPGDEVVIGLEWTRRAEHWRCQASVSAGERPVATVRLRYPAGGAV